MTCFYLHGIFVRDSPRKCSHFGRERSIGSETTRRAENYLSSRDEQKLFNRVSCSERRRRAPARPRVAASLRAFYFRPYVPAARPAGMNRRHRRNLDRGRSSTKSNRSRPHAFLSVECLAQIVPALQIVKITALKLHLTHV